MQHFAIVIDDRIVSVPYVNFDMAPNGIDGADGAQIQGVQIQGGLTPETARQTAAILGTGPLPAALVSPQRRRRRALATTDTLVKAIAADAITGLSRPAAASGMAARL